MNCFGKKIVPELNRKVFLGGACGTTNWRSKVISTLTTAKFDYFNPQIEEWSEECIEIERREKKNSSILMFVFTNDTRGQATLVEAAQSIGEGRKVVLVLNDYDSFDNNEKKDINRGRAYLRDVANKNGVKVFSDLDEAVKSIIKI